MKWPGISLKTMMLAVAIVAADIGIFTHDVQEILSVLPESFAVTAIGLLPMVNLIAFGMPRLLWLGLPRLLRRVRRMPFSIGFQVTSWASTLAVAILCMVNFELVSDGLYHLMPGTAQTPGFEARTINGGPLVEVPVGFFESCREAVQDFVDVENLEGLGYLAGFMLIFSLPPLLVSLAGGLITRHVVRRRSRAATASRPAVAVA